MPTVTTSLLVPKTHLLLSCREVPDMLKRVLAAATCVAATAAIATPGIAGASTNTTAPRAVDIRVASFNILTATAKPHGNRLPWKKRRAAVVKQILGEHVDAIAVQEAYQSWTRRDRYVDGPTQFYDLKKGLVEAGGHYRLTNHNSYNCANARSTYHCRPRYRGASGGDRILYNTSTLRLVRQGSYKYHAGRSGSSNREFMAWAILQSRATGRKFLFTGTHLSPNDRTVRVKQWNELIAKINRLKGSLPVVAVGDFNTQKFDNIAKKMLPRMKHAGYGDVRNQTAFRSSIAHPRARHTVNGWLNSWNRLDRNTRHWSYWKDKSKAGNAIDWIFASNSLPVKEYKMVLNYSPSSHRIVGSFPSDHNMIRATLTLR
jgi:endonuclease/exonuclease/phosphatase family metal-dependent hydrolase